MRFLQASDFHLDPDRPERLDALAQVVRHAVRERADAVLIPGDLFDAPAAAEALRADVRRLLETFDGPVVIIPGNHDLGPAGRTAFPAGADYGRRTVVLRSSPWERHVLADRSGAEIAVIGVPFRHGATLGRDLAGLCADPLATVLLAHGTLQAEWVAALSRDEGDEPGAYYPIRRRDLEGRFAYAALGHFHGAFTFRSLGAQAAWGYAGSAIAITRRENGPRHAVLVDLVPGSGVAGVRPIRLDTPYWEECAVAGSPCEDGATLAARLRVALAERFKAPDARRSLRLRAGGWIDGDETAAREALERIAAEAASFHAHVEIEFDVRAASHLLEVQPWLGDLLDRVQRIAADRNATDGAAARATDLLIEAAAAAGSRR
jgi:DNA repair exonuclease SbcCD nuclease subunit